MNAIRAMCKATEETKVLKEDIQYQLEHAYPTSFTKILIGPHLSRS